MKREKYMEHINKILKNYNCDNSGQKVQLI